MKTLKSIFCILFMLCLSLSLAQTVTFDHINSDNVLKVISEIPEYSMSQKNSETQVLQYGDQNFAEIAINGNSKITSSQIGDYNYLNFDNSFEKNAVRNTITAEGNNNIIDITGSNSISEKLQIHVKGDNMTIFMRNY